MPSPALKFYLLVMSVLLSLLLSISLAGCTFSAGVAPNIQVAVPPAASQIPIRVGLYVDRRVRDYRINSRSGPAPVSISVGPGLSTAIESATRAAFRDVVLLDSPSTPAMHRDSLKAVVIPSLTDADFQYSVALYHCQITLEWVVVGRDRQTVYTNTFVGEGESNNPVFNFTREERISECMTLSVRDHITKFLNHILSVRWYDPLLR
jgi:hypothetical protein